MEKNRSKIRIIATEEEHIDCNVRHGMWMEDEHSFWCSECREDAACDIVGDWYLTAYCPSCGAKMDKKA